MFLLRMVDRLNKFDNRKKRFDIVLLDADETVFDFKRAEANSLYLMLSEYGVIPTDEMISRYSEINLSFWKLLERGEISREELKVKRFEKFFCEIGIKDLDYAVVNDKYLDNLANSTFLLDGAEEFVKTLNKYVKVYIATNGLAKAQTGRFAKSAIKNDFDGAFISEQIGVSKPDKEYFDYIFQSLKIVDKSRVIILGDSLTSDMLGGRNAGITTCLFNRSGNFVESELCDYQISNYNDFFDIIFE